MVLVLVFYQPESLRKSLHSVIGFLQHQAIDSHPLPCARKSETINNRPQPILRRIIKEAKWAPIGSSEQPHFYQSNQLRVRRVRFDAKFVAYFIGGPTPAICPVQE